MVVVLRQATDENQSFTYDGQCVAQVMAAIEYLQCASTSQATAYWDLTLAAARANSCKMFYGEGALGDACTTLESSNGDSCNRDGVCEGGICVVRPGSAPAETPCTASAECAVGLACLPKSAEDTEENVCVELPEAGQECYLGAICNVGLTCNAGSCAELPPVGHPCAAQPDLLERTCSPVGECVSGTCQALPGAGEDCPASSPCAPGFACLGGTCRAEDPAICGSGAFPLFPNAFSN
jgi:hypothetical protein